MTDLTANARHENGSQSPVVDAVEDGSRVFRLDGWTVEPALMLISRNGSTARLEPKVMAVLEYLAQRPGQLVSREELEEAIWTGTIVSYDALTGAIQKLRKAFNDDPRRPRIIETLSKKGYRLIAPVESPVTPLAATTTVTPVDPVPNGKPRSRRPMALAMLLSLLLAATSMIYWYASHERKDSTDITTPSSNTIAVLPFDNLSREPGQNYFTDGMTDELITGLAKHPELLVIARDSIFMYRDSEMDTATIAQRLNVRYLVEGSVFRDGQRVRINAQLIDSRNGSLLWADSYDGSLDNIFELQGKITGRIVAALKAKIVTGTDGAHTRQTSSNQAYDSFLMGRQHFYLYHNREENHKARELFEASLRYDPEFAMAYAMLAWTHVFEVMNGWSDDRQESLQQALQLAGQALGYDTELSLAYWVRGLAYRESGDYSKALVEAEQALHYDPNYANAHILLASLLYFAGRPEEGLEKILKAMAINPHHPFNYTFHLGQAYFTLHRYEEAIDAFRKGIESNPGSERIHVWLAAALARAGAMDDAHWEVTQIRILNPEFSLQRMEQSLPFSNPSDRQHVIESLRMAGLS